MSTKIVILEFENHKFVRNLAFIKESTIQKEVNSIIETKRKELKKSEK